MNTTDPNHTATAARMAEGFLAASHGDRENAARNVAQTFRITRSLARQWLAENAPVKP